MRDLSKIIACGGTTASCNIVELQLRSEYDVANNIWYSEKDDFDLNERTGEISGNTSDATPTGALRTKNRIDSISETKSWNFAEDYTSAWMKLMHQVQLQSDDYIVDFMNCGLNYRKSTCFSDLSYTRQTYYGLQTTSMGKVFEQLDGAENEVSFSVEAGNAPVNELVGFTPDLPDGMIDVVVKSTVTSTVEGQISVTLNSITDESNLIVDTIPAGNELIIDIWNEDFELVNSAYIAKTDTEEHLVNDLTSGTTYMVAIAYHAFTDSDKYEHYRYIDVKKIEVK